ncbi:hypothetical protein [Marinobacter sp. SS21]|uniref:hypothetical protein n=1 Tax=Marinobacter sp. SS21 TaxID=2979460 RepID=UPI00232B8C84|nr:hypothetical protein [Marinobacter sp. SS21]MDC0662073.1 hypothetical protein [Marinobacter sp. SS21]
MYPQISRFLAAVAVAAAIYLAGLFIGDWLLGSRELGYQWQFESKRQLVLQLAEHAGIAGSAILIGLLCSMLLYRYNRYAGRLALGVVITGFAYLAEWNWQLGLLWTLALVAALAVTRGARL